MLEQLAKELVKIFLWVAHEKAEVVGRRREEEKRVKSMREVMTRIDARKGSRDPRDVFKEGGVEGGKAPMSSLWTGDTRLDRWEGREGREGHHETQKPGAFGTRPSLIGPAGLNYPASYFSWIPVCASKDLWENKLIQLMQLIQLLLFWGSLGIVLLL